MYSDGGPILRFHVRYKTITDTDPQTVQGQCGNRFGLLTNYIFTSTGQQLETVEGRKLCEKLGLTWK